MVYWTLAVSLLHICWIVVLQDLVKWGLLVLIFPAIKPYIHVIYISINLTVFFIIHFTNVMHVSVPPLLWWLYDDDTTWWISRYLQKFLNFSQIKFVPASDIGLLGSMLFCKDNLISFYKLSVMNPSTCICHWHLAVVMYNTKIMLVI